MMDDGSYKAFVSYAGELERLRQVNKTLLGAAKAVLEVLNEPCRYDHHGLCQTHHLRTNDHGEPECEVGLLRAAIKLAEDETK